MRTGREAYYKVMLSLRRSSLPLVQPIYYCNLNWVAGAISFLQHGAVLDSLPHLLYWRLTSVGCSLKTVTVLHQKEPGCLFGRHLFASLLGRRSFQSLWQGVMCNIQCLSLSITDWPELTEQARVLSGKFLTAGPSLVQTVSTHCLVPATVASGQASNSTYLWFVFISTGYNTEALLKECNGFSGVKVCILCSGDLPTGKSNSHM